MPRLTTLTTTPDTAKPAVEFVLSEPLDLVNAMYFTRLARDAEGVEGFPVEVRKQMAPDLLAELDFLYDFPIDEPGLAGTFGDYLWLQPQTWGSVSHMLHYLRNMPLGIGDLDGDIGIQGLAFNLTCGDYADEFLQPGAATREALGARIEAAGGDAKKVLALWDHPEELRERLANLIERFYNEHYKAQWPERLNCLERSVAAHRGTTQDDVVEVVRGILKRDKVCLEGRCGPADRMLFAPSVDMGPYASCASIGNVHGMFYPCEARFVTGSDDAEETIRMARIHKALGDEQRLRMLEMLRGGEMYVQEIVDRTGLHQSVVSRHLMFLKAVGLLEFRKQNNMKFYSLSPNAAHYLQKTLDMFASTTTTKGGSR
jgi:DNA-binding transcriptional ArsR family regulator